jgi:hypothetical protein
MSANHQTRLDTHRVILVDDACAEEGGIPPGHWRENQGRPILKAPESKAIKTLEEEYPYMWLLYVAAISLSVGISILVGVSQA